MKEIKEIKEIMIMERLTGRLGDGGNGRGTPLDGVSEQDCFNRLAYYEDMEEHGKLLRLPFSMTEEVYTIFNHRIVKGIFAGVYFKGIDTWFAYDQVDYDVLYKGKIIHAQGLFETYEEAKAKLEG